MGHRETGFLPLAKIDPEQSEACVIQFEIFVAPGFCDFEMSSVTQTLLCANQILGREMFKWRFVSERSGLIKSVTGMLVRTDPAIVDYGFSDVMVVLGGRHAAIPGWMRRARSMQRKALPVVLLSDAATAYIRNTKDPVGKVTTHWRDVSILHETAYVPNLTGALSENSNGIVTAAGAGSTCELVLGLIAPLLEGPQVAELGNRLLLPTIRKSDAAQPSTLADSTSLFDVQITRAIQVMEAHVSEPLTMSDLVLEIGVSTRHLERMFRRAFDETPARFYKALRAKRAQALIVETVLPLIDVAIATGFYSSSAMSAAVKEQFGETPTKMRARRGAEILKF